MIVLALLFAATAALYASVGFGGGSTYNALLILSDVEYAFVPIIALSCNITVVTGNVVRYWRAGLIDLKRAAPLVLASIPAAWLGGRLAISEAVFTGLLGASLLAAGVLLIAQRAPAQNADDAPRRRRFLLEPALGGGLGFLSGMVGIGGGIFLSPILNLFRWAPPKSIAALASLFILVNSAGGVAGQLMKLGDLGRIGQFVEFLPLIFAVALGGFAGNYAGVKILSETMVRRATGILVLYVSARLLIRWASIAGF
ncbi:MAG: sulfite exporter TauE/SafE family protein [Parvularculaceae bacterium]